MLLDRHFFFKAVQETNEELTKIKDEFLVDFTNKLCIFLMSKHYLVGKKKDILIMIIIHFT